jgi:ketosteroid isomerase-like protein
MSAEVGVMKKLFLVSLMTALLAINGLGQKAAAGKTDPTKGVHAAFDRLVEGITQVDVDKVMGVYEKSDRLLIFNNNGTATQGWDNVRGNVVSAYAKVSNVALDITGLRVEMLGKTAAYVSCKWKQTQENDGKIENASGRMTLVFRLIGKDWKIVHRHTSPDLPGPNRPLFPSEREAQ